ncbi:hypothetical protein GCM10027347_59480 [Larkinella harenae]
MTTDVQFKTGRMTKEPRDMTPAERATWQQQMAENARDYLFSIGQPLVYKRADGRVVAEHKDGRVLVIQ